MFINELMVMNGLLTKAIFIIIALVFKIDAFKFPDNENVNDIDRRLDYNVNENSEHMEVEPNNTTNRKAKQIRGIMYRC